MEKLSSVQIRRFKRIEDAPFDLDDLNLIVGANNAGKSSVIQGLHFAISLLQSINLLLGWSEETTFGNEAVGTSINPNQLIYSPSEDIYSLAYGGTLFEAKEKATAFIFTFESGKKFEVQIRKGRNRNVLVSITNASVALPYTFLGKPFSVFSPGLAGVSRNENLISDGVLLRALARGDANLVLRNILWRLWNTEKWADFHNDLISIFPNIEIDIRFEEGIDEHIGVFVKNSNCEVPIDLAGTGVLQTAQILSYLHNFSPKLIVLDEPDSHLHPDNQRKIATLLRLISKERDVQVILTTHSRHILEVMSTGANVLWAQNGKISLASADDEVSVLLDIGALSAGEKISADAKAFVLTEDEDSIELKFLLRENGFDLNKTTVLSYYGVSNFGSLRALRELIRKTNPIARIIAHRDRDYLNDGEVASWEEKVREMKLEPFVTDGTDIEAYYLNANYLAQLNPALTEADFEALIAQATSEEGGAKFVERYVNARVEIARSNGTFGKINLGALAVEAPKILEGNYWRYRPGKIVLARVRKLFKDKTQANLRTLEIGVAINVEKLNTIAKKAFKEMA
jgi:AAA15 family ATPase/GTPase